MFGPAGRESVPVGAGRGRPSAADFADFRADEAFARLARGIRRPGMFDLHVVLRQKVPARTGSIRVGVQPAGEAADPSHPEGEGLENASGCDDSCDGRRRGRSPTATGNTEPGEGIGRGQGPTARCGMGNYSLLSPTGSVGVQPSSPPNYVRESNQIPFTTRHVHAIAELL
jgi:hypothetical protein